MEDELSITVVATGFDPKAQTNAPPAKAKDYDIPAPWEEFFKTAPRSGARSEAPPVQRAAQAPPAGRAVPAYEELAEDLDVDKDHDTVIGMLVDKLQRERGRRKTGDPEF
jgi:hypothetical protein